jgi:hypothetical protein
MRSCEIISLLEDFYSNCAGALPHISQQRLHNSTWATHLGDTAIRSHWKASCVTVCAGTVPYDAICVVMVLLHDDRPLAIFSGIRYNMFLLFVPSLSFRVFRQNFVRHSLDFSSGALWQNLLAARICHKNFFCQNFVRISSEFRLNLS